MPRVNFGIYTGRGPVKQGCTETRGGNEQTKKVLHLSARKRMWDDFNLATHLFWSMHTFIGTLCRIESIRPVCIASFGSNLSCQSPVDDFPPF